MLDIKYGLHGHTTAFEYPMAISANATATDMVSGIFVKEDPAADGCILAVAADVTAGEPLSVIWDGYSSSPGSDFLTLIKGRFIAWVDETSLIISTNIETDFAKGDHLTISTTTGKLVKVTTAAEEPYVAIVREVEAERMLIEVIGTTVVLNYNVT